MKDIQWGLSTPQLLVLILGRMNPLDWALGPSEEKAPLQLRLSEQSQHRSSGTGGQANRRSAHSTTSPGWALQPQGGSLKGSQAR